MSSIFSVTNNTTATTNSTYSMFFSSSSSSSSSSTSNLSGLFSGSSTLLGDYSMIKSGSYKKLLSAYYDSQDSSKETNLDGTADLLGVKSDADSLKKATDSLNNRNLYESTGVDEDGKAIYDREKILSAVKSYVQEYNDYLESSGDLNSTAILKNTLDMTKKTAKNANMLSKVGITIDKENKLVLDEEKLNSANISDLTSLFVGNGSYGDGISQKANQSYRVANSTAYTNTRASSYTFDGTYSLLGTENGTVDTYK